MEKGASLCNNRNRLEASKLKILVAVVDVLEALGDFLVDGLHGVDEVPQQAHRADGDVEGAVGLVAVLKAGQARPTCKRHLAEDAFPPRKLARDS